MGSKGGMGLGLKPDDVIMKNPNKIWPLLKKGVDHGNDLKHLADCLDLQAHALNEMGQHSPLARAHAMKFYSMANALDSYVRVGQDYVDEFVARHDYDGARDVLERNVLPTVIKQKMVSRIVPVRSQYAVVLAYCGDHETAAAEVETLAHYESGLSPEGQHQLREQRRLIASLRDALPQTQLSSSINEPASPSRPGITLSTARSVGDGRSGATRSSASMASTGPSPQRAPWQTGRQPGKAAPRAVNRPGAAPTSGPEAAESLGSFTARYQISYGRVKH